MVSGQLYALFAAAKLTTLLCGGVLTALSLRAARRTGSPALRALALGMGLVTLGTLAGGLLHRIVGLALDVGVTVSSAFTALGLGVMTYSLYAETSGQGVGGAEGDGGGPGAGGSTRADD
jgi:hypothetical protein